MNSMALWALVILVMTLPEATLRAHIVITDTVALVLSRLTQGNPWHHRTYGLGAIKGLYLGLLINTEDDGRLWRVQVDPSNVSDLFA